jgi:hypothetical protein
MVMIQTAHGDALPVSYQFPSHEAVLTAVMSLNCEPQPAKQNASDRSLVGLIKWGVRDQKEIYSAPFHRQN